jgi:hypothetical protein
MAFGIQASMTLADVNSQFGNTFRELSIVMARIEDLYQWYLTVGAAGLEAAPFNMSTADANTLGSAITDSHQLVQIYQGSQALASAKDFRTFIKQGYGMGF